jgi:hypothetical protein
MQDGRSSCCYRSRTVRRRTNVLRTDSRAQYKCDGLLFRTTRLNRDLFDSLLDELRPFIERRTDRHDAIPADTQLLVALGFYASGGFQWLAGILTSWHIPT